jgi:multimeric flavodoxin WrbA
MTVKILILKSSGNKKGSSNMLADEFIRGARESGHTVTEYDVFRADIRPCIGCGHCGMDGACVQKDDYETTLKGMIKETDMIVFAMPVYYYNWPAQLKAVVDRFYSYTTELARMKKKTALVSAAWDDSDTVFAVVEAYYRQLCDYMDFRDQGVILGRGCGTPAMTKRSRYMKEAYELGRKI